MDWKEVIRYETHKTYVAIFTNAVMKDCIVQKKYRARMAERAFVMKKRTIVTAELIGRNIRRLREKHGETQQQLGEALGYGATTITNYESGYRMPDLETFFMIAFHYEASLEDFIQVQVHES